MHGLGARGGKQYDDFPLKITQRLVVEVSALLVEGVSQHGDACLRNLQPVMALVEFQNEKFRAVLAHELRRVAENFRQRHAVCAAPHALDFDIDSLAAA